MRRLITWFKRNELAFLFVAAPFVFSVAWLYGRALLFLAQSMRIR